jgi:hypothetical protein
MRKCTNCGVELEVGSGVAMFNLTCRTIIHPKNHVRQLSQMKGTYWARSGSIREEQNIEPTPFLMKEAVRELARQPVWYLDPSTEFLR